MGVIQMAKKVVTKGVEDFSVAIAYNGFVIDYSGRTEDDDYEGMKIVVASTEELFAEIQKILDMA
jgi:hypothetical protein